MKNRTYPAWSLFTPLVLASASLAQFDARAGAAEPPAETRAFQLLAWGDYDGDGLLDAFAVDVRGTDKLLRNTGDGRLEDVSSSTLACGECTSAGATWVDVDGDGLDELYTLSAEGESRLLMNVGGVLVDVSAAAGLVLSEPTLEAHWIDLDHNDLPDLHVVTPSGDALYVNRGSLVFEPSPLPVDELAVATSGDGVPSSRVNGPTAPVDSPSTAAASSRAPGSSVRPYGTPLADQRPLQGRPGTVSPTPGVLGNDSNVDAFALSSGLCALGLNDTTGGACIEASATPTVGKLYPLGQDFFVTGTGNVGIGTLSPSERLQLGEFFVDDEDVFIEMRTIGGPGSEHSQGIKMRSSNPFFGFDLEHDDALKGFNFRRWDDDNASFGDSALFVDRANGNVGLETTSPGEALELGTNSTAGDRYIAVRTAGGNQYRAGIKFSHFDDTNGFVIESDETGAVNGLNITHQTGGTSETALYIDRITGSLGVGTTAPTNPVHLTTAGESSGYVHEDGTVNMGTFIADGTDCRQGGYIGSFSNHPFSLFTNGTCVRMIIDENGNVGIGTENPDSDFALDVEDVGQGAAWTGSIAAGSSTQNKVVMGSLNGVATIGGHSGDLNAWSDLSINPTGNVGVGTQAPTSRLHVSGTGDSILYLEADTDNSGEGDHAGVSFSQDGDLERAYVGFNDSVNEFKIQCDTNDIDFETGDVRRMRITLGGNIGIGTDSPSQTLSVNGSAGKPGGGSWSTFSDARLKTNVHDLEGALETLLALRGVTFEYTDASAIGELDGERIGFIAQEVEDVLPDWVDDSGEYRTLTIRGFEALAVEALRELRMENEELARGNRQLEARVARLEAVEAELAELTAAVKVLMQTR